MLDFQEAKAQLTKKLEIGYDGTTLAGGIITVGLVLMLTSLFIYRMNIIFATHEHIFVGREAYYSQD